MWKFITFAALSIIWSIVASSEYDETDMYSKPSGCNTTLNKKHGGFHIDKTNATYCHWDIDTNNGTISLYFYYLFMHDLDTITLYPSEDDYKNKTNQLGTPITALNGSVTVITGVSRLYMAFHGNTSSFLRNVVGYYTNEHMAAIPPEVEIIYSPIYAGNVSVSTDITYNFNKIQHKRATQVFTFEQFSMSESSVTIEAGGSFIGPYTHKPPTDFFLDTTQQLLSMKVTQAVNSSDYFMLKIAEVDSYCSGVKIIENNFPLPLPSPPEMLNNGTIVTECRWLVQHKDTSKILGLQFHKLDFHSVFDIAAVNNGQSEISTPILQVTTSNKNISQNHMIRSGSSSMWISFKPVTYASTFIVNVTVHGQGGYFKNSQSFKMEPGAGDDTAFLLEVDENEIVYLTFDECVLSPPATLSIYDGFDTNKLLTSLRGPVKFPILSGSSKLMIVATNASTSHFRAKFQGISHSCDHMSSLSTENYILSELSNSTCSWIIPPQNKLNSELLVYLQFISLQEGDLLEIHHLDANLTKIGSIGANVSHVPHIAVEATVGALIKVTQGSHAVKTDKVVLIGHSSYIPDCSYTVSPKSAEAFQISSPLYPDTYPLFTHCQWNISAPKGNFVHLAFDKLKLAQNHCVRILENSNKTKHEYDSKTPLPDDLFITGDYLVQFDSSNCDKKEVGQSLNADVGFLINTTVADYGIILTDKTGEFNTNITDSKSLYMWKLDVSDGSSVNVISYTITYANDLKNYDLAVYDGSSVRDAKVENDTNIDVWSRSSSLIFVYRRLNISQPSGVLVFKYHTINCNKLTLCDNKICMHPDWKCNGINDCGDYSDEQNCKSEPVPPPEVKFTGYSATAFWLCILAMVLIGIIVGLGIPVCYQKYKDSRYTRFRELSGIDG